jgi:hypothetical protein
VPRPHPSPRRIVEELGVAAHVESTPARSFAPFS